MQLFEFFFQTGGKKSIKEMHQSALTCQQHEQQLPGLPTYAEAIRTGPSNQPLSTPVYVGYLTPGVKVQAPLGDPSIRTHMPTHSPYSATRQTMIYSMEKIHRPLLWFTCLQIHLHRDNLENVVS